MRGAMRAGAIAVRRQLTSIELHAGKTATSVESVAAGMGKAGLNYRYFNSSSGLYPLHLLKLHSQP